MATLSPDNPPQYPLEERGHLPDFRSLAEQSPLLVFRDELERGIVYANPAFLSGLGLPQGQDPGGLGSFTGLLVEGDRGAFREALERLRARRASCLQCTLQLRRVNGEALRVEGTFTPVWDHEGNLVAVDCIAVNVEDRERISAASKRNSRHLEGLIELQGALFPQLDLEPTFQVIVETVRELLKAESCALYLADPISQQVAAITAVGRDQDRLLESTYRIGEGLVGRVIAEGAGRWAEGPGIGKGHKGVEAREDCGLLCVPLSLSERTTGALLLLGRVGQFGEEDLNFSQSLVRTASLAISSSRSYDRLQRMANTDMLTGAFNRFFFNRTLPVELNRAGGLNYSVGLLLLDVDGLKEVNDKYGHLVGDELLRSTVATLRQNLRGTDWVTRFGGDEFAVVLSGCAPENLQAVAEKLQTSLRNTTLDLPDGDELPIKVSLGGSVYPQPADNADQLVQLADQAERESKRRGDGRVILYLPSSNPG